MTTIEKKYNEALERFKAFKEKYYTKNTVIGDAIFDKTGEMQRDFESIFQEFRESESEDERIRKDIVALIKFALEDGSAVSPGSHTTKEEALSWLEKQKEPENTSASTIIPSCHEELTEFELVLFNAVLDNNFVGAKGGENALAMTKKVAPALLAIAKKEPDWDREKCFVCQEYEKGFKQGHLEGFTAGYNKAMKEVDEEKENPKNADSIPTDCASSAKCEDRSLKHTDSFGTDIRDTPAYWRGWDDAMKQKEQKPAEWSEEDEKMRNLAIEWAETMSGQFNFVDMDSTDFRKITNWLKSLRPSWKPSEEQLAVLLNAEGLMRANDYKENAKILAEVIEELKKLCQ